LSSEPALREIQQGKSLSPPTRRYKKAGQLGMNHPSAVLSLVCTLPLRGIFISVHFLYRTYAVKVYPSAKAQSN
jgi:hypothetical protein